PRVSDEIVLSLSASRSEALVRFARHHRLTLSSILHAAWALLLARYTDTDDVIFGSTVAGRPPELPHVEEYVALLLSTIPLRVRVPEGETALDWLRDVFASQIELREHVHCSLIDIQAATQVPGGTPLFETLLVVETFPWADRWGSIRLEKTAYRVQTN